MNLRLSGGSVLCFAVGSMLAGCQHSQSALSPTGVEAERISFLFWIMTAFGTAILVGVMLLATLAILGGPGWRNWMARDALIVGGGIVFPIVTLSVLLGYGLFVMGAGPAPAEAAGTMRVSVVGERWWWRVLYTAPDGTRFESANEIRLPVGKSVSLELATADVIHSFWAPRLAGKLDMIPGRTNVLTITATEAGISRGQCAEYCGGPHAMMAFYVAAMEESDFQAWFEAEAGPAQRPEGEEERLGQELFLTAGCGACHTVRGTPANGTIGPDLTHVGSRMSLAAATLANDRKAFARWIVDNQHIKPENLMPPFEIFDERQLSALSAYLAGLR